jgi:hypothetical protein
VLRVQIQEHKVLQGHRETLVHKVSLGMFKGLKVQQEHKEQQDRLEHKVVSKDLRVQQVLKVAKVQQVHKV